MGDGAVVPFPFDFEVHIRYLVALPLLIAAEVVVHRRMRPLVQQFLERNPVPENAMPRFDAAIASAFKWSNSVVAEWMLIAFVYGVGILIVWRNYVALDTATWYATPTAKGSKLSFAAMWYGYVKIGYPDQWFDFRSVGVSKDDLLGNLIRYEQWQRQDEQAMLKGPYRKSSWTCEAMPHQINAYYTPSANEIVFPAAILQPPFFDANADPAVNFAAIGTVIGHEISHGFDDQGNRYDGSGAVRNWWTEPSRRNFEQRADELVAQFDAFSPLPGLHVSGRLTLGENIGDLGGIAIAWSGYQKLVASEYAGNAPVIEGYSGSQRFFLGYAQLWRSLYTDAFLRRITLTDAHSPSPYRVNGILRNFGPWYETYGATPADALYLRPEQRVSIW